MANRTTEDEVGLLSKLVTSLHTVKAQRLLELIADAEEGLDPQFLPTRDIAAMGKWCLDNGILALPDSENAESELSKTLEKIKSKSHVVDFREEMRERGLG